MRKLFAILAMAWFGIVVGVAPASATPQATHLNRLVSGPFTGTQSYAFGAEGCSFVHQVYEIRYVTKHGLGSVTVEVCVTPATAGSSFDIAGTFSLRAPRGGTLRGTVAGTTDAALPASSLDLTLTPTQGTGQLRRARGSIALDGTWMETPDTPLGAPGPTSGALTGHLIR